MTAYYHRLIVSPFPFTLKESIHLMEVVCMKIEISSQPESFHKLFIHSLKVYSKTFFHVFWFSALISIITFLPRIIELSLKEDIFTTLPMTSWHQLWFLLIDLVCLIVFTAILWRIQCALKKQHETILDDLIRAIKKLPLIIVAAIIQMFVVALVGLIIFSLIFLLGSTTISNPFTSHIVVLLSENSRLILALRFISVLAVFVIIYLFFAFYFYLPLILTENKGVFAALKESVYLVWGNWWRTVVFQISPWIVYVFCLVLFRFGLHMNIHVFFVEPEHAFSWLDLIFQIILFLIFVPWFATILLVQLRDLETRKKLLPPK